MTLEVLIGILVLVALATVVVATRYSARDGGDSGVRRRGGRAAIAVLIGNGYR